jgi:hypothetical protein
MGPHHNKKSRSIGIMKKTLTGLAILFAAGLSHASYQSYYQCNPTGCTAEGSSYVSSTSDAT